LTDRSLPNEQGSFIGKATLLEFGRRRQGRLNIAAIFEHFDPYGTRIDEGREPWTCGTSFFERCRCTLGQTDVAGSNSGFELGPPKSDRPEGRVPVQLKEVLEALVDCVENSARAKPSGQDHELGGCIEGEHIDRRKCHDVSKPLKDSAARCDIAIAASVQRHRSEIEERNVRRACRRRVVAIGIGGLSRLTSGPDSEPIL